MKTIKEKYPEKAKLLKQSTFLILLSIVMIIMIPILNYFELVGKETYLSLLIFIYILIKQCKKYEAITNYIEIIEKIKSEEEKQKIDL